MSSSTANGIQLFYSNSHPATRSQETFLNILGTVNAFGKQCRIICNQSFE